MIAIDSSAVVAILRSEPLAAKLMKRLTDAPMGERRMSTASYLEVGAVLAGARSSDRLQAVLDMDRFLSDFGIELVAVDEAQARLALRARIEFGRGMGHGGPLNFGDCFSYALAKSLNAPLLYVGDDFTATDVVSAV